MLKSLVKSLCYTNNVQWLCGVVVNTWPYTWKIFGLKLKGGTKSILSESQVSINPDKHEGSIIHLSQITAAAAENTNLQCPNSIISIFINVYSRCSATFKYIWAKMFTGTLMSSNQLQLSCISHKQQKHVKPKVELHFELLLCSRRWNEQRLHRRDLNHSGNE